MDEEIDNRVKKEHLEIDKIIFFDNKSNTIYTCMF